VVAVPALLVAQDPAVVLDALMKLAEGSPAFAHELRVDAFLQQVRVSTQQKLALRLIWSSAELP
jgi:hypothetical protein